MAVKNFIPKMAIEDGCYYFSGDDYMEDLCSNGFGVPWEALEVGYREYANRHGSYGSNWFKTAWWMLWALFKGYRPRDILYAVNKYDVRLERHADQRWKEIRASSAHINNTP